MADEPMGSPGFVSGANLGSGVFQQTYGLAYLPGGTGSGSPSTAPSFRNRVWDTAAGPAFVRWTTQNAADPSGSSYPGPGTFGVDTTDYVIEYRDD